MLSPTLRLTLAALLVTVAAASTQERRFQYFSFPPTPYGDLMLATPELAWSVWSNAGQKVSSATIEIDGKPLKARYDSKSQTVRATPPARLAPGTHSAKCTVNFDSGHTVDKSWRFRVLPGALPRLPAPAQHQRTAQKIIDQFRKQHGLPAMNSDPSLHAAAQAHSEYMADHSSAGHSERPGRKGFTGRTPGDRARAFGYFGRNSESVAKSGQGLAESVRRLFDAPYHRVMFLQPGSPDFGAGFTDGSTCLKIGGDHADGTVLSPPDRATSVPREWDGVETPDPLRKTRMKGPVGYPIVMAAFGQGADTLRLKFAELTTSGRTVPIVALHPGNDNKAKAAIILVPRTPLTPRTRYDIQITYTQNSRQTTKQWSFTTRG